MNHLDFQTTPHCVYALIEDEKIVYVGCTYNPKGRLYGHKATGKCSKDATLKVLRWYPTPKQARRYEAYYVAKLRPPRNVHLKRMAVYQARKIWQSHPRRSDKSILKLMPGWTLYRARYEFGSRGVYFSEQRRLALEYRALGARGTYAGPKVKR